jgi:hypothetical protein
MLEPVAVNNTALHCQEKSTPPSRFVYPGSPLMTYPAATCIQRSVKSYAYVAPFARCAVTALEDSKTRETDSVEVRCHSHSLTRTPHRERDLVRTEMEGRLVVGLHELAGAVNQPRSVLAPHVIDSADTSSRPCCISR